MRRGLICEKLFKEYMDNDDRRIYEISSSVSVASRRITHKGRFATFVPSCSALHASKELWKYQFVNQRLVSQFNQSDNYLVCLLSMTYISIVIYDTFENIIFEIY